MKNNFTTLITVLFFSLCSVHVTAQNVFFKDIPEVAFRGDSLQKRVIKPFKYRTISLDTVSFKQFLKTIPSENAYLNNKMNSVIIHIPLPNGEVSRFRIWESSIMEPALAAQFPQIKTYAGQGIDDPTATIRLDWTEFGFHAMILSPVTTSFFIDNYTQGNKTNYISYFKKDFIKTDKFIEYSLPDSIRKKHILARPQQILAKQCIGTQLRTYRLAVACTGEYAKAATGKTSPTVAEALSAITTTVNRVVGVYEKELSIRMILVANESSIVYTNPSTDPFNGNNNANTLINESQTVIDANIGNANYDVGHTFSTGGGGVSLLGVVCITGDKASSITGSPSPVGDPYDIDYVSHEVGHAFGADHPFNSTLGSCDGNGSNTTNAEPGSGSTIMAYAGICDTDDLQPHSDPQFHAVSLDQIATYTINQQGNNCAVKTNTGNTPPVVSAGASYTIPKLTPFVLTGSATDADGDALTYSWEQTDVGGTFGAWNVQPTAPSTGTINVPLFRSFAPVTTPTRYFPKLSDVINNTTTIGEVMPAVGRTLHFRLTARDNRAGGGGVCFGEITTTVSSTAGPFIVTYPDVTGITWDGGSSKTITWNTASTNLSPISCANVSIQLSTDGGLTYPTVILASTPNDGSETITVPNIVTSQGRIRIVAVGNIFYDISNNNFSITVPVPTFTFKNTDTAKLCGTGDASVKLVTNSLAGYTTPINLSVTDNPSGTTVSFSTNPVTPGDSTIVTLNNAGSLAPGIYNITVTGVSGSITKTQVLTFVIGISPTTLTTPADLSIGQLTNTTFNWVASNTAASYTLEVSISNTFASLVQSITGITTNSYTLTTPLAENTIYYWRVYVVNACGTSAASPQFLFKTGVGGCTTFMSTNVPRTISSTSTPNVASLLNIPTASGVTITDVNVVSLAGTHTYIPDLTFILSRTSPATSVTLFDQICGNNAVQNFNLNLDDQSANKTFPCPPVGNITVAPANPLAAFNGQNSGGRWTLTVKDNAVGDGGSLTSWGLQICSLTSTPLDLTYTFTGNGNWDIPSNWLNSSVPPATLITGSTIIIDPVVDGECYLNIPYTVAPGSTLTVMPDKKFVVPDNFSIQQN
ncbi:M12 family metallo-peptidase [Ferruginibacter lapsinanis]|uniref:reprolysin-like metallopeptidase n=1 Tax=Ferruginibacter lapsinanis TaxID=563172 RepID=UPI001E3DD4A8|nr:M12 family metallo-peptidase [Ferruginibacter lapsinanis]UEG49598.1 M12 family metallo-peptidase [Ferruginibacter lapsinanis]